MFKKSVWYFGDVFCRISQYTSNVTAYVIILLLVFMSLDRYMAINIIGGTSIRNQKNATLAVTFLWLFILITNIPHLLLWKEHSYQMGDENRTVCILKYNIILSAAEVGNGNETEEVRNAYFSVQAYYAVFFTCGYVLPFVAIFVIYGLIMLKLRAAKGKQVSKSKKRVTFMVVAVVSSFVLCWGPLQTMLFLQHVVKITLNEFGITIMVISNCIAYLNACINPIIYGFANQDFRT
jgi:allatostatin receptor